jgi:hypothetical protein
MSSRIAERLASRGMVKIYKVLTETFAGTTSYITGGNVYNSTIIRNLERVTALNVTGGYFGEVVTGSISGNAFKLKIYTGTATGPVEITAGVSLITSSISVLIEGL